MLSIQRWMLFVAHTYVCMCVQRQHCVRAAHTQSEIRTGNATSSCVSVRVCVTLKIWQKSRNVKQAAKYCHVSHSNSHLHPHSHPHWHRQLSNRVFVLPPFIPLFRAVCKVVYSTYQFDLCILFNLNLKFSLSFACTFYHHFLYIILSLHFFSSSKLTCQVLYIRKIRKICICKWSSTG